MTTIITRLFPDAKTAQRAVNQLIYRGMPKRSCTLIEAGSDAAAAMKRARVDDAAASAYAKKMSAGQTLVAVSATYKPLGAARLAREVMAKYDPIAVKGVVEERKLAWEPDHAPSVLKDHPQFLSVPGLEAPKHISAMFGLPMLKERGPKDNLMPHRRRMSRLVWPMPLLRTRAKASTMRPPRRVSRMFWPMPLLSTGSRRKSVIPGGGTPLSRRLGLATISKRG